MRDFHRIMTIGTLVAAVMAPTNAIAATPIFNLSADPAAATYGGGGDTFTLDIPYFDGPFTIASGDIISINLLLDSQLTTPTLSFGDGVLFLEVLLSQGLDTPVGGLTTVSDVTLNDGTYAGETQFSGCANCIFSAFGKPAQVTPFGFSSLSSTLTIEDLAQTDLNLPVEGTGFRLSFAHFGSPPAVPEPATWAMMLLGFFGIGSAVRSQRRRQRLSATYA